MREFVPDHDQVVIAWRSDTSDLLEVVSQLTDHNRRFPREIEGVRRFDVPLEIRGEIHLRAKPALTLIQTSVERCA